MPDFKPTLHLPNPESTLPMKAELARREPEMQAKWRERRLYHRILDAHRNDPLWVLHDGPPYTNSPVHMGTAMQKILKDTIIKSRAMSGFRAPYVPGFDNHGLPIEQAVAKRFAEEKKTPTRAELLEGARAHAQRYIDVQTEQFQRLGVFGLWENPYKTMDFRFEAGIVRVFKRLVEGEYVYRGLRPTLWSPTLRSALADTEIIYKDVTSKAIDVAFPVGKDALGILKDFPGVRAVIWTTTPWTIPANLAIAFHPEFRYVVAKVGEEHFIVVRELLEKVAERCGWGSPEILREIEGAAFEGLVFRHPIFDRDSLAVMADYVTTEDGTGLVHTAPSHGRDDFYTGQRYHLGVPNTVDEGGVLTEEAGEFAGTYYKKCDTVVVDRLREVGALLSCEDYNHSYPHGERDDQPVIFRATDQWFVALDQGHLRERALDAIRDVEWIPPQGETRITAMVRNRPDWCVSRQRPWGVGIPIFYTANGRIPVLDPVAIERVAELVEKDGSGAWFDCEASEILGHGYDYMGETEFTKETDVLDVWFDSGSTCLNVLADPVHPEWRDDGVRYPADLYFEGSDQHRGWFNSSLLLGMAVKNAAPYKAVVTHGFVVDEQGRKFSKRLGNGFEPMEAADKYGADVIRLWAATIDWSNDAPCSFGILEQVGGLYRDLRNTLRFLIGNLPGFDPETSPALLPIDEWIVEECETLCADVREAYERYDLSAVVTAVYSFCRDRLSRVYLDAIKDRMYCDAEDSASRRSGQAACLALAERLTLVLAPILVHTAEEAYGYLKPYLGRSEDESIHERNFLLPDDARLLEIEASDLQLRFAVALDLRERINAAFEPWKGTDGVKAKKDAVATATVSQSDYDILGGFSIEELATIIGVSWLTLTVEGDEGIVLARSPYPECARSRLRRADVATYLYQDEEVLLTPRDAAVLGVA